MSHAGDPLPMVPYIAPSCPECRRPRSQGCVQDDGWEHSWLLRSEAVICRCGWVYVVTMHTVRRPNADLLSGAMLLRRQAREARRHRLPSYQWWRGLAARHLRLAYRCVEVVMR